MLMNRILVFAAAVVLSGMGTALGQAGTKSDGSAKTLHAAPPALSPSAPAYRAPQRVVDGLMTVRPGVAGTLSVSLDRGLLSKAAAEAGPFTIRGFPLSLLTSVDLEVERFWVTRPNTRFVSGTGAGFGDAFNFDPRQVVLLRGHVAGQPRSHVFLGISDWVTNGVIDLGPGGGRYGVSNRSVAGPSLPVGELSIFRDCSAGPNPIPSCSLPGVRPPHPPPPDLEPRRGLRQLELAVETDYEFFVLFGDQATTMAYLVQLYAAVSDVYIRELNVRIDLTFVRVWPQPNEPFTASLSAFQSYWNANMGSVPRDAAQMFSGRGDLPGGVAYLPGLCDSSAYSFCGNAVGTFADARTSNVFNYDPQVTAHELGHNCGTPHTHDDGLDSCADITTVPRRGTIMSYCNQTVSGAMGCMDMSFHKVSRQHIQELLATASCIVFDCNQNGRSDATDILLGFSQDVNSNGIPDECEDCNHNGILDSIDIANSTSRDLNTNGIPDECEPDCNNNQVPDDRDILLGTSQDLYGDGVPDECDADLNHNNQSDYNEIMANMMLDKDRDRTLDAFQDCDHDTIPDLQELQGAHDAWVASQAAENVIREYHAITGVLMNASGPNTVSQGQDVLITPDRRILVSSAGANSVVEFDRNGALVRTLVAAGAGGLNGPAGMLISGAGTLLVASRVGNSVLEYDLGTGAFIRAFAPAGSGGLISPFGLTRGPNGNVFVSCGGTGNKVLEFNGSTGAFVRTLVATAAGSLSDPHGLVFKPTDGNLLVASTGNSQIKEYNGSTGAFLRNWQVTGVAFASPWGIRIGRDGQVYVSRTNISDTHLTRARILIFDIRNGNFIRALVQGQDSLLTNPTGFDFMPGDATDCNHNGFPDNCDIAMGYSADYNLNGIPDECERDCYANCDLSTIPPVLNVNDFVCFQAAFVAASALPYSRQVGHYANCDGSITPPVLNVNDFICFQTRFAAACP
jgi:hypothetical protein